MATKDELRALKEKQQALLNETTELLNKEADKEKIETMTVGDLLKAVDKVEVVRKLIASTANSNSAQTEDKGKANGATPASGNKPKGIRKFLPHKVR